MTTHEAATKLFNTPYRDLVTDMKENTWKTNKKRFREGKLPLEKIEQLLERFGYKVIQEKLWDVKTPGSKSDWIASPADRFSVKLRAAFLRNFKEVKSITTSEGEYLALYDGASTIAIPVNDINNEIFRIKSQFTGKSDKDLQDLADMLAIDLYSSYAPTNEKKEN